MQNHEMKWRPKLFSPNRRELLVSFVCPALWFGVEFVTRDERWQLVWMGILLVALFCALNALLDFWQMTASEKVCAVLWTPLVTLFVLGIFWTAFGPRPMDYHRAASLVATPDRTRWS